MIVGSPSCPEAVWISWEGDREPSSRKGGAYIVGALRDLGALVRRPESPGRPAVGSSPWPSIELECILLVTIVFARCFGEYSEGALP